MLLENKTAVIYGGGRAIGVRWRAHELFIGAPAEQIYSALTTQEGLSAWWTDASAKPERDSVAGFTFGPDYFKEMKIKALTPSTQVRWICIAGADEWVGTTVSFGRINTESRHTCHSHLPCPAPNFMSGGNEEEGTMNARRIEGAVALVTGANRGIGRALTEALLTRGVRKVYASAREPEALRALRDERLVSLRLDVTDVAQIGAAAEAASDVELVFNNAGVALARGIAETAVLEQARREMEVNYFGPLQLLLRLAPTLARNGGGAVINIGSAAGLSNLPFVPTYSASKAALHSLTQAARLLLGAQGTSVFGVYAGPVDTDMNREFAVPKSSPRNVAFAILDGIEAGQEDIFPDPFAADFGRLFESSPKAAERQMAATTAALLSGSAA